MSDSNLESDCYVTTSGTDTSSEETSSSDATCLNIPKRIPASAFTAQMLHTYTLRQQGLRGCEMQMPVNMRQIHDRRYYISKINCHIMAINKELCDLYDELMIHKLHATNYEFIKIKANDMQKLLEEKELLLKDTNEAIKMYHFDKVTYNEIPTKLEKLQDANKTKIDTLEKNQFCEIKDMEKLLNKYYMEMRSEFQVYDKFVNSLSEEEFQEFEDLEDARDDFIDEKTRFEKEIWTMKSIIRRSEVKIKRNHRYKSKYKLELILHEHEKIANKYIQDNADINQFKKDKASLLAQIENLQAIHDKLVRQIDGDEDISVEQRRYAKYKEMVRREKIMTTFLEKYSLLRRETLQKAIICQNKIAYSLEYLSSISEDKDRMWDPEEYAFYIKPNLPKNEILKIHDRLKKQLVWFSLTLSHHRKEIFEIHEIKTKFIDEMEVYVTYEDVRDDLLDRQTHLQSLKTSLKNSLETTKQAHYEALQRKRSVEEKLLHLQDFAKIESLKRYLKQIREKNKSMRETLESIEFGENPENVQEKSVEDVQDLQDYLKENITFLNDSEEYQKYEDKKSQTFSELQEEPSKYKKVQFLKSVVLTPSIQEKLYYELDDIHVKSKLRFSSTARQVIPNEKKYFSLKYKSGFQKFYFQSDDDTEIESLDQEDDLSLTDMDIDDIKSFCGSDTFFNFYNENKDDNFKENIKSDTDSLTVCVSDSGEKLDLNDSDVPYDHGLATSTPYKPKPLSEAEKRLRDHYVYAIRHNLTNTFTINPAKVIPSVSSEEKKYMDDVKKGLTDNFSSLDMEKQRIDNINKAASEAMKYALITPTHPNDEFKEKIIAIQQAIATARSKPEEIDHRGKKSSALASSSSSSSENKSSKRISAYALGQDIPNIQDSVKAKASTVSLRNITLPEEKKHLPSDMLSFSGNVTKQNSPVATARSIHIQKDGSSSGDGSTVKNSSNLSPKSLSSSKSPSLPKSPNPPKSPSSPKTPSSDSEPDTYSHGSAEEVYTFRSENDSDSSSDNIPSVDSPRDTDDDDDDFENQTEQRKISYDALPSWNSHRILTRTESKITRQGSPCLSLKVSTSEEDAHKNLNSPEEASDKNLNKPEEDLHKLLSSPEEESTPIVEMSCDLNTDLCYAIENITGQIALLSPTTSYVYDREMPKIKIPTSEATSVSSKNTDSSNSPSSIKSIHGSDPKSPSSYEVRVCTRREMSSASSSVQEYHPKPIRAKPGERISSAYNIEKMISRRVFQGFPPKNSPTSVKTGSPKDTEDKKSSGSSTVSIIGLREQMRTPESFRTEADTISSTSDTTSSEQITQIPATEEQKMKYRVEKPKELKHSTWTCIKTSAINPDEPIGVSSGIKMISPKEVEVDVEVKPSADTDDDEYSDITDDSAEE